LPDLENRVTYLERDTAVLNERSINQGMLITETKNDIAEIKNKLDAAMKRPPYTVVTVITLLSSATVGLLVYVAGR